MLNLTELEQFVAFADCGTLAQASEQLHLSQPTLTRTMRHVEDAFGVSLFHRGKNRITLNETGQLAVSYARQLLSDAGQAVQAVQSFDRSLRTITVESCAPAPLWSLLPALSQQFPENTISSKLTDLQQILSDVASGKCEIGILPFACPNPAFLDAPYLEEHLSVCIPHGHPLSQQATLTFADLNGFNCLLRDKIGFWTDLCQKKMPCSRFLIQTNEFEFQELVRTSSLFCFQTNLASLQNVVPEARAAIPITDPEANVTYHIFCLPQKRCLLQTVKFSRKLSETP